MGVALSLNKVGFTSSDVSLVFSPNFYCWISELNFDLKFFDQPVYLYLVLSSDSGEAVVRQVSDFFDSSELCRISGIALSYLFLSYFFKISILLSTSSLFRSPLHFLWYSGSSLIADVLTLIELNLSSFYFLFCFYGVSNWLDVFFKDGAVSWYEIKTSEMSLLAFRDGPRLLLMGDCCCV